MPSPLQHIQGLIKAVGVVSALNILARRTAGLARPTAVRLRDASRDKVMVRPTQSDLFAAAQVFGWEDYQLSNSVIERLNNLAKSWRAAGDVPVIIDGGSNVGYASVYFANRFPEALVLAIEPDPDNFAMLQQNISQHENIRPMHGALWHDESGVELKREASGGWSTSTIPSRNNGGIPSWRIEALLRQVPRSRVLILKLDIEGAERQVCDASPQTIRTAPCVIVEPHDYDRVGRGCLTPLFKAISGKEVDTLVQGDALVFLDSSLSSPAGNLKTLPEYDTTLRVVSGL
jgi:FkbM family methyltransferase